MGYRYFSCRYTMKKDQNSGRMLNVCHLHWRPSTDIYETTDNIFITAEIAGVDPAQMDIALYENALVINGQRQLPCHAQPGMYDTAEIRQGIFYLEVPIMTSVDPEKVNIHSKNGLLIIALVKNKGGHHGR